MTSSNRSVWLTRGLLASLALLAAAPAFSAKIDGAPAADCQGLKVATGPEGKGYSKLFRDMNKACGAVVPLCEVRTSGGLENFSVLSTKGADIAPGQVDTWTTVKGGDENVSSFQAVAGLNYNFLHVVTASRGYTIEGPKKLGGMLKGEAVQVVISRFSDLRGKRVALVGSAQLLGAQLNKNLGYGMDLVNVKTDDEAFAMVANGQVAAAFALSGWPSDNVAKIDPQKSGLTMVPFDAAMSGTGFVVKPIGYKNLGVWNNNALAMPNVLFTRPFKGEKAVQVAALRECLVSKLEEMQEGDFQPAWNEIKSLSNTYDVPRFVGPTVPAATAAAPVVTKKK